MPCSAQVEHPPNTNLVSSRSGGPKVELYHNNISVCAQKVRIVLTEKNVPWTNHHLRLAKGEQLTPEFKALNPRGGRA